MSINDKTYQFKIGMMTSTANHQYTSGVEVRIQYQRTYIGRILPGQQKFLADLRLLNQETNMDMKQYHLEIRTQHDLDTRDSIWSDTYRDIEIDKQYISSLNTWPSIIVIQLANVLSGGKQSDTSIGEDGHGSVVNEFNTTNDEVKAWNALHKLVTLMESKMK